MNPMPERAPMLKQLRLSGILDSLESRNKQAIDKKMPYPEFLALLIADEVARRDQKRVATRLRRASFRSHKTLDQFDFSFNPNINSALVHGLITGRFIEENVALSSSPGPAAPAKATSLRPSAMLPCASATTSSLPLSRSCSATEVVPFVWTTKPGSISGSEPVV